MPRLLSPAIQSAIAEPRISICHLLSFQIGEARYFFAEDAITFEGEAYTPALALQSPIRYTQSLQSEPVTVALQNVTLETIAALRSRQQDLQGTEARLRRLFLK